MTQPFATAAPRRRRQRAIPDRLSRYDTYESFFRGDESLQLAGTLTEREDDVRVVWNYTASILRKHANKTVRGLACTVVPKSNRAEDRAAAARAQTFLDTCYAHSQSALADFAAVVNSAVLGDGCFRMSPSGNVVTFRWEHPGDIDVHEWSPLHKPASLTFFAPDRREDWTTDAVTLTPYGQANPITLANPYNLIPFVVWQNSPGANDDEWGESDIEHLVGPARILNERLNSFFWKMRVATDPPLRAVGADEANLVMGVGRVWKGSGDISPVKVIDTSEIDAHLRAIALAKTTLFEISNTPGIAFGDAAAQLSGIAIQNLFEPMQDAASIRRTILSDVVQQRNAIMLRMGELILGGMDIRNHYDTEIAFSPITDSGRDEASNTEINLVAAGLHSRRRAMRATGVTNPVAEATEIERENIAIAAIEAIADTAQIKEQTQ